MQALPDTLRQNVKLLGKILGTTLTKHESQDIFEKIEEIRSLSKPLTKNPDADASGLIDYLSNLPDETILPIVRSFNQFLNLANIADQHYFASVEAETEDHLSILFTELLDTHAPETILENLDKLKISFVLTAHPTEVTRRTLIQKYEKIANTLTDYHRSDLLSYEHSQAEGRLNRLIEEVWNTNEIRKQRPTAVDEAKWGFAVIENSFWYAVPNAIRHVDGLCQQYLNQNLSLKTHIFEFFSWMGGDRDGNPNVTHDITQQVILLARWKAADLYLRDIEGLIHELSMTTTNVDLIALSGDVDSPYRSLLHKLEQRLIATRDWLEHKLKNNISTQSSMIITTTEQLLEPILLIHKALISDGYDYVANGPVTDTIRRINAFGINLVPLDIRQDSARHTQVLDELTKYLELGSYESWTEERKINFLLEQLSSKRPLIPQNWPKSAESEEVLATCRVVAEESQTALSHYIISMAKNTSDVLAVALLLKETGVTWNMPIMPLFETLDDLNNAAKVMNALWQNNWYQQYCSGKQTVMIGYSDSGKDAGKLAATWAQYEAQEELMSLAEHYHIDLTFFHGRGGTVGRGGGPLKKAMDSQPPGSVAGHIRVTEQGEMIRYKFGMPRVAFNSLCDYVSTTLRSTISPTIQPKEEWRSLIKTMAKESLNAYRKVVRDDPNFVPYFRSLTPEQELGKLALGSRPAKRKATGGVESLRAIPWIFAWMQVRLNLPSWLGTTQALEYALENEPEVVQDMLENWPFFSSFIDLLEMVVGKADIAICTHYEKLLTAPELSYLGEELRNDLIKLADLLNGLKQQETLLDDSPVLQSSIHARKPYIDPLNYLQAELLKRKRENNDEVSADLEEALKVTMTGISAGMRNTG
jgi:phosphoenolpyruvate carboxylase